MKKFSVIGISKMLVDGEAVWFCPFQADIEAASMVEAVGMAEKQMADRKFNTCRPDGTPLKFHVHEVVNIMDMGGCGCAS